MHVKERAIKSDLAIIDKLRDEHIDYSDIPELDDVVFAQPPVTSFNRITTWKLADAHW